MTGAAHDINPTLDSDVSQQIVAAVAAYEDDLIELTRALVACRTDSTNSSGLVGLCRRRSSITSRGDNCCHWPLMRPTLRLRPVR